MRFVNGLIFLLIPLLASQSVGAQGGKVRLEGFDTSRPPRGLVTDPQGQPIAGATVSFRVSRADADVAWRNTILRRQPLPRVRTSRDGEFFIPLTQNHRLLGRKIAGDISLVVEKEGFLPWVEPLTTGLRGYLGSKVELRPIAPEDRFVIEVKNPRPGMWVRVHRFGSGRQPGIDYDRWYEVPASGVLDGVMSATPHPVVTGVRSSFCVPIGITVQLLYPGRSTQPIPLEYGQRKIVLEAKASNSRFVCVVRGHDGKAPPGCRGLYRCPDRVSRWFPVDPENVVESSILPLDALIADGHLALDLRYEPPRNETARLQPAAGKQASLLLRDEKGQPVADAAVTFFDLEYLPLRDHDAVLGPERGRRRLRVQEGKLDLAETTFPGPGFLWIEAKGRPPAVVFEPRGIRQETEFRLERIEGRSSLTLTVVDEDARPVRGVYAVLPNSALRLGSSQQIFRATDANGKLELTELPRGTLSVQLVGPGIATTRWTRSIKSTGRGELRTEVQRAAPFPIRLVDEEDVPQPFRMVRVYTPVPNRPQAQLRLRSAVSFSNSYVYADSFGRILLSDLALGAEPRLSDAVLGLTATHPQQAVQTTPELLKVRMMPLTLAIMPLPAQVLRECFFSSVRSSSRTMVCPTEARWALVRFPHAQLNSELSLYLREAAPLRINSQVLAAARKAATRPGPLRIDQRRSLRTIRLAVTGFGDANVGWVRPERPGLNFARNLPALRGDSGLRIEPEAADRWKLSVRDRSSFSLKILHPEFLLTAVDVPELLPGQAETPIPLRMERGTPVVFRVKSTTILRESMNCSLYAYTEQNTQVVYQRETLARVRSRRVAKGLWELHLPVALRPGKYFLSLRITGTPINLPRTLFTVPETGPLVIEVNRRTGKVLASGDLESLKTRIKKLTASIEALRKNPPRDAKSKASFARALERLQAQLEANKEAVLKLQAEDRREASLQDAEKKAPMKKEAVRKASGKKGQNKQARRRQTLRKQTP